MTFKIPNKEKRFLVDNASTTRGNVYSTYNINFDNDMGRMKLNQNMALFYSEADEASFKTPFAIVSAEKAGGSQLDTYILTTTAAATGYVYSTLASLAKITAVDSPAKATDSTSDMCLYLGAHTAPWLYVSDADGLHYVDPSLSTSAWTLTSATGSASKFILVPFLDTNRLYLFTTTSVVSMDSSHTFATSGAYTLTSGLSGITCARASSKRIWFATSGSTVQQTKCKIYEWDGVNTNIHVIDTEYIQSITILNDLPVVIDGRGRLWFYDGFSFNLKDGANIPLSEFDIDTRPVLVHRNGMITEKGKIYCLVQSNSAYSETENISERGLAGIWCYDPKIGFYHYSSPEDATVIRETYALAKYTSEESFIAGYRGLTTSVSNTTYRVAKTSTGTGIGGGDSLRRGFIVTPFLESKEMTNDWNTIGLKYRDLFYTSAQIEVKYRTKKAIECNITITWTSATTFTASTATLAGTGTYYNSAVAIGNEVLVQNGANVGVIAHITNMVNVAGTTTVTIDRSVSVTSGTAYACISNFKLLSTMTYPQALNFNKIGIPNEAKTMIQVKVYMQWKGYFDELQEILVIDQIKEKL